MGLSRTVSEINGDFSRKSHNKFPTPMYFAPPLTRFPLELHVVARSQKTGMMGLPEGQKGHNTSVTDRRTITARRQKPHYVERRTGRPEAQLMLTNPRDAFRGQSRSPNMVPFDMLGMVSY